MDEFRRKSNRFIMAGYLILIGMIGIIILYLIRINDVPDKNEDAEAYSASDIVWYDEYDRVVARPDRLIDLGTENHSIYTIVPEDLPENVSLCFRDKHVLFSVYVAEECIYEQHLPESRFYTNSVGAIWTMIPLKQAYAGQKLYIRYDLCYEERGVGFDHIQIGSDRIYLVQILKDRLLSIILPIIYLVIGVIMIFLDAMIYKVLKEKHNFFYLGCLAISVASYCLAETQIFPFFIADQKIMHLIPMLALAAVPIPAIAYAEALFGFKSRYTASVLTIVSIVSFIVLTVLNFLDIYDYHDTVFVLQFMLLVSIVMMFYAITRYTVLTIKAKKKFAVHIRFTIIGLAVGIICASIDLIKFWLKISQDIAQYTRIGFLLFLVCFLIASSEQIIEAFRNSMKTALISRLAYEDGLTGLRNRTSYNEALDKIIDNDLQTGIVMMDVNDLKYVNDHEGHDAGDSMLTYASEIIRDAFQGEGITCYRIGGDEFVALVQTAQIERDCERGIHRMEILFQEFNDTTNFPFKIRIAAGYDIYALIDQEQQETALKKREFLEKVIKSADSKMYLDKKRLKKAILDTADD